jgi:hypothetical protein
MVIVVALRLNLLFDNTFIFTYLSLHRIKSMHISSHYKHTYIRIILDLESIDSALRPTRSTIQEVLQAAFSVYIDYSYRVSNQVQPH